MTAKSSCNNSIVNIRSDAVERAKVAHTLPFILRAWWLRDRIGFEDLNFGEPVDATLPLWSLHSDPICDAANMDVYRL
jgi:hypothetical protein